MASDTRKAQWRAARANAREAARRRGRCIVCLNVRVKKGRSTCAACGERANAAARRRRERLAASPFEQARAFGIDVGQLVRNLRLSPAERFRSAERVLRMARELKRIHAAQTG